MLGAPFLKGTEDGQRPGGSRVRASTTRPRLRMSPPPRRQAPRYFSLDVVDEVLAARPLPLVEVRPQLGVMRHTAEQVIETFVPVQVLDAPVPQVGGGAGGRIHAEGACYQSDSTGSR